MKRNFEGAKKSTKYPSGIFSGFETIKGQEYLPI